MTQILLRYCFIALLVLLPTQLGLHFWPDWAIVGGRRIDYFAPTLYLTDILIVLLVVSVIASKAKQSGVLKIYRLPRRLWLLAMTGCLFVLLNIYFSLSPWVSVYKWLKVAEFGFLFWCLIKNNFTLTAIRFPLFIAVFYSSILAIWQFVEQSSIGGLWYFLGERTFTASTLGIATAQLGDQLVLRPYGTFSHPNVLGGFLAVVLLLVLSWLITQKLSRGLLVYWVTVLLGYSALFLTLSRTAIIVGLGATFIVVLSKLTSLKQRLVLGLIALLVLIVLFLPLTNLGTESESLSVRSQLNTLAIKQFINSPVIGTGLGTSPLYTLYSVSGIQYQVLNTTNYSLSGQPVHNLYLLILSETGIGGFTLFIGLLFYCFIGLLRRKSHLLVPLISVLFLALFDHYFLTSQQGLLLLLVAVPFACNASIVEDKPPNGDKINL